MSKKVNIQIGTTPKDPCVRIDGEIVPVTRVMVAVDATGGVFVELRLFGDAVTINEISGVLVSPEDYEALKDLKRRSAHVA